MLIGMTRAALAHADDTASRPAVDQGVGSPLREKFHSKVLAKTPLDACWTKRIFTGRGRPPREAPNSWAIRKLVADNSTLIGYIDKSALDASIKPVLLVH
jgi:hypothetical protein